MRQQAAGLLGFAVVRGRSMEPTFRDGDRLLVRYGGRVMLGRCYVVRLPDGPHGPRPLAVKRVSRRSAGRWWLDSDHREAGTDSWAFGPVPDGDVVARVVLRLSRT